MIESYFFIPAHSKKFLDKSKLLNADFFILDLEDSVPASKRRDAFENCISLEDKEKYIIRPYLTDNLKDDLILLNHLIEAGYKNILLPKSNYLNEILSKLSSVNVILLIEQAYSYLNAEKIVVKHRKIIKGLALGSHDLTSSMSLKSDEKILNIIRLQLLLISKTYSLKFIDTASMNISNGESEQSFKSECINAFNLGCDGKFIIHPKQLDLMNAAEYFSASDLGWALPILDKINIEDQGLGAIKFNNQIIEKPHLRKLKLIKKYLLKNGIK